MTYKQCEFCAWCLKNYPEEIALTIYPVEMKKCPRCLCERFELIEADAVPKYKGAPEPKKPQKSLFKDA